MKENAVLCRGSFFGLMKDSMTGKIFLMGMRYLMFTVIQLNIQTKKVDGKERKLYNLGN